MAWYGYILLGIIIGIIIMYLLVKADLGSTYEINNKVKNRRGNITESTLSNQLTKEVKKERFLKRIFNKKQKL